MPNIGGSPTPRAYLPLVSPPVSGTIYVNSSGSNLLCSLTAVLNPTLLTTSSVTVEISTDGNTWQSLPYAKASIGGVALNNVTQQLFLQIPYLWFYRVTMTNASVSNLVAIG